RGCAVRALHRLGVALPALDARPRSLPGPQLRRDQSGDVDRLLGPDRSVLLRHALPAADGRLLAARRRVGDHPDLADPLRALADLWEDRYEHRPRGADVRGAGG